MFTQNNLKILIVDDSPAGAYQTSDTLNQSDLNVSDISIAKSALQAMYLLGNSYYDCIICNGQLATTTGLEFVQQVKRAGLDQKFILLAGSGVADIESASEDPAVIAVLAKATLTSDQICKAIKDSSADIIVERRPAVGNAMAW